MIRRNDGFTLIEVLIVTFIFLIIIAGASTAFIVSLNQYKQQSQIAESNIEGVIGLDMMRRDIYHAGIGLPWSGLVTYTEKTLINDPYGLNDSTATNPPRAIVSRNSVPSGDSNNILAGTDILVIKSVGVAVNDASQKMTTLPISGYRTYSPASENLATSDRVIVLSPGAGGSQRVLVTNGAAFYTTLSGVNSSPWLPSDTDDTRLVYGLVTSPTTPVRPFNRADYFVRTSTTTLPSHCAAGTGVLYKATMDHDASGTYSYLPLLDCVADMQVVYGLDMNADGIVGTYTNPDASSFSTSEGGSVNAAAIQSTLASAALIRQSLKEVRVYILAQEGQMDRNLSGTPATIDVGRIESGQLLGRAYPLSAITNYRFYRWRVYSIVIKTDNLRL